MNYLILLPVVAVGLTLLVNAYLRYAAVQYRAAAELWPLVEESTSKLISDKTPPAIRQMAFRLGMTTGCGCYVTGVIVQHYLPALFQRAVAPKSERDEQYATAISALDANQRRQLDRLIGAALAYDALSHPIVGFFAVRIMKYRAGEAKKLNDLPAPPAEAKRAVMHTLGSKRAERREHELCAA